MACPICKKKEILYSLKVRDYEYDLKTKSIYNHCKSCESIYRNFPNKLNKNLYRKKYTKVKYLPLKGNFLYDFLKKFTQFMRLKKLLNFLVLTSIIKKELYWMLLVEKVF